MMLDEYKFRVALAKAGKHQTDIARLVEKTNAWVTSMKRGNFSPSEKDAKKIAKFLGCKIEDIFVIEKKVKGEK